MEKEGYVSLWLGNFAKQEQVEEILQIAYSDEGDFVPSIFAMYFNITRYDDAVREAEWYEKAVADLGQLLEGFSYDDEISPKFSALCGEELSESYNTVILLYNFQYVGDHRDVVIQENHLKYMGSVEYR